MARALIISGIERALQDLQDEFPGVRTSLRIHSISRSHCALYPPGDFPMGPNNAVAIGDGITASAAIRNATDSYRKWMKANAIKT